MGQTDTDAQTTDHARRGVQPAGVPLPAGEVQRVGALVVAVLAAAAVMAVGHVQRGVVEDHVLALRQLDARVRRQLAEEQALQVLFRF